MATREEAQRHFKKIMATKEPRHEVKRGLLGNGSGTIRVVGRPDYVYVRINGDSTALHQCVSHKVADIEGTPVLLRKLDTGSGWEVYDVDVAMLADVGDGWNGISRIIPTHAETHEWLDGAPGLDPVNINLRSLVPLRCYPKDTTTITVRVAPLRYSYSGEAKRFAGGDLNLTSYQPAAGLARYVLTYLDPRTNTLGAQPGGIDTYSAAIDLPVPTMPDIGIPSALVRVWGNRSFLDETDIVDYRMVLGAIDNQEVHGAGTAGKVAEWKSGSVLQSVTAQSHVPNAATDLSDLTVKFNSLITYLENTGILNTA